MARHVKYVRASEIAALKKQIAALKKRCAALENVPREYPPIRPLYPNATPAWPPPQVMCAEAEGAVPPAPGEIQPGQWACGCWPGQGMSCVAPGVNIEYAKRYAGVELVPDTRDASEGTRPPPVIPLYTSGCSHGCTVACDHQKIMEPQRAHAVTIQYMERRELVREMPPRDETDEHDAANAARSERCQCGGDHTEGGRPLPAKGDSSPMERPHGEFGYQAPGTSWDGGV